MLLTVLKLVEVALRVTFPNEVVSFPNCNITVDVLRFEIFPSIRKPSPSRVTSRWFVVFRVSDLTEFKLELVRLLVLVTIPPELEMLKNMEAFPFGALPPAHRVPFPQVPVEPVVFHVKLPCAQTCPVHEKAKARTRARKHGFTKPKNTPRRVATPLLKARGLLF
jgi:hypothetical protein